MGIEVHDPRLPDGVLEVETDDPKLAASAAQKYIANNPAFTPGRWAGLTARNAIQGVAALPATLMDIPAQGINFAADAVLGKGKGPRFNEMNQNVAGILDKVGLPRPTTPGEQFGSTIAQSVAGAGTGMGLGGALSGARAPVAAAVGQRMASAPGTTLASGVTGGGAAATAAQMGAPWWAQAGAGLAGGIAPSLVPSAASLNPARLVRPGSMTPMERQALASGFTLPPATMDNPTLLSKLLGGWGGKIKGQQQASSSNQVVTRRIAARELELPDDTTLDDNVFSGVRSRAGRAYTAVRQAMPQIAPDDTFRQQARALGSRNSALAREFPELVNNEDIAELSTAFADKPTFTTEAGMDAIQTLRASSTKNLQAIGDPQRNALGFAQRQAAQALEDLIERRLSEPEVWRGANGQVLAINPSEHAHLVTRFQNARTLIAKSHDIEAATNSATGEINARKIAQLGERRPLTGGLRTLADMGNAFPKATQLPSAFGGVEPLSVLDVMAAAAPVTAGAVSGHLGTGTAAGALALSRPLARAFTQSRPYQDAMRSPAPTAGPRPLALDPGLVASLLANKQQQKKKR
jgi:hypothetical protein